MKPIDRVLDFLHLNLDDRQHQQLLTFGQWLATEAVAAGGIGSGDLSRLDSRHLADSLLFASQLGPVAEVWDLGSGVGLPGIPLAIVRPETSFVLIDRSGRRVNLARRAVRVLGLENCQVKREEIGSLTGRAPALVARASLSPDRLRPIAEHLLPPGGVMVTGGSWIRRPQPEGWVAIEIPEDVLGQPVWLLKMRRS